MRLHIKNQLLSESLILTTHHFIIKNFKEKQVEFVDNFNLYIMTFFFESKKFIDSYKEAKNGGIWILSDTYVERNSYRLDFRILIRIF